MTMVVAAFFARRPSRGVLVHFSTGADFSQARGAAPAPHIPHCVEGTSLETPSSSPTLPSSSFSFTSSFSFLVHHSPPSGFANPLTGSKSDSLGIQQIKICPLLPDQCLCLPSGLVWLWVGRLDTPIIQIVKLNRSCNYLFWHFHKSCPTSPYCFLGKVESNRLHWKGGKWRGRVSGVRLY